MTSRRETLVVALCACAQHSLSVAQPTPRVQETPSRPELSTAEGCGLAQLQRRPGLRIRIDSSSFGRVDELVRNEIPRLCRYFRVTPQFSFIDDSGYGEALALPGPPIAVLLGKTLVTQVVDGDVRHWPMVVRGILAHEWAHAMQYSSTAFQERAYMAETHADFMCGWYLGCLATAEGDIEPLVNLLRARASKKSFFDPDTHGQPDRRAGAALSGYAFARRTSVSNRYPDPYDAANEGYRHARSSMR